MSAAALVAPPPGLEDRFTPVKVDLRRLGEQPRSLHGTFPMPFSRHDGAVQPGQKWESPGDWLNAVLSIAPSLDAGGVQQALHILDKAIGNLRQAQELEGMITGTGYSQDGRVLPTRPQLIAAQLLQEVYEKQRELFERLQNLEVTCSAAPRHFDSKVPPQFQKVEDRPCTAFGALGSAGNGIPPAPPHGTYPRAGHAATATKLAFGLSGQLPQRGLHAHQASSRIGVGAVGALRSAPLNQHQNIAAVAEAQRFQNWNGEREQRAPMRPVPTLSDNLQILSNEDPRRLFIVRRINKLGFKASRKLKQHFMAYGTVIRVHVAHSTVKEHGELEGQFRQRPSSLGFVHMASEESVLKILALGEDQEVEGALIRVQRFVRQTGERGKEVSEDAEKEEYDEWDRQGSAQSTSCDSTACNNEDTESADSARL